MHSPAIAHRLNHFKTVMLPSSWGAYQCASWGVNPAKLRIVKLGYDPSIYYPGTSGIETPERFRFLCIGKYEERKSIDKVVHAFSSLSKLLLASGQRLPLLTLKCAHQHSRLAIKHMTQLIGHAGIQAENIELITSVLSESQMRDLYHLSHCFVLPTKGEGFGLPTLEAIASGLPVITTYFSGQSSYLKDIRGLFYPLKYTLTECNSEEYLRW